MSNRKLAKAIQQLFRQIWKLYRSLSKGFVTWLLRAALLPDRRRRRATSGFVLPTTVFLVLVVTLTSGALSYRAFSNSSRVIGTVQSKEVYNAATPALDRARIKLESLFTDSRYPGGVPSEGFLTSMMLNDGRQIKDVTAEPLNSDPYNLSDEVRVDVNGDGQVDNAWIYRDEQNKSNIIYSITFSTPPDLTQNNQTTPGAQRLLNLNEQEKANGIDEPAAGPFVRSAPIGITRAVSCAGQNGGSRVEQGWYIDPNTTSKLWKRFQVNAFVVKDDAVKPGKSGNFTTLEFAQDRILDRGNKWGAWFRNDLEVYPGATFNWNGAMHSEGSIFVGGGGNFNAYLISSPNSCLFLPQSNSEISVRQRVDDPTNQNDNDFWGVIAAAFTRDNTFSGSSFPVHTYDPNTPNTGTQLNTGTQWVATTNTKTPSDISLNPEAIVTQDVSRARGGNITNADSRIPDAQRNTTPFVEPRRFKFDTSGVSPYLDDTYRADNRYGPKKVYKPGVESPAGQMGNPIPPTTNDFDDLTRQPVAIPSATAADGVPSTGLDGYWERRAMAQGLRLLVSERLELGNPSGWVTPKNRPTTPPTTTSDLAQATAYTEGPPNATSGLPDYSDNVPQAASTPNPNASDNEGDPLYPPYRVNDLTRAHEERERKALRDNPAAVQTTAVYHYGINGGTYPVACLATTAHPGTVDTLKRSLNFTANPFLGTATPWVDFFYGNGTNGWEFSPPVASEGSFASQVGAGQALGNALRNLANFAGDPDGAYPPQQGTRVRPDPTLTMWGNFSNLRRTIRSLDAGVAYNDLSPADKSYLQTASCTLGLLAYNINQVQDFNLANVSQPDMYNLGIALFELMDGDAANGEVIPNPTPYNARNYDNVTPAMMLAALRTNGNSQFNQATRDRFAQLGILIHEKFQIQRDRTYGFRPSPAANTWNYNPYVLDEVAPLGGLQPRNVTLWSSACDPTIFAQWVKPAGTPIDTLLDVSQVGEPSLGLSRLCGTVTPPGTFHNERGDNNFPAQQNVDSADPNRPLPFAPDGTESYVPQPKQTYYEEATPNSTFTTAIDDNAPTDPNTLRNIVRATVQPEFPALYYVFPEVNHNHAGPTAPEVIGTVTVDHRQPGNTTLNSLPVAFQPWREPYITSPVISDNTVNGSVQYRTVVGTGTPLNPFGAATQNTFDAPSGSSVITSFKYRAFNPLADVDQPVGLGSTPRPQGGWITPTVSPQAESPNRIITPAGTPLAIAFQDKVLFNGREWQPSRVLDLDLDLLRRNVPAGVSADTWLPKSGIVYAFREDAVREDAIARPVGTTQVAGVRQTSVRPGTATETDPPATAGENTTKPVDYVADPDRRAHGFRLRRGERLQRVASLTPNDNRRGLSFFSDDVVYIMGDFNKHQTSGGAVLEEFREQLNGIYDPNSFYGRRTRDGAFADPTRDEWRPSEVLGDSVTILSRDFCDGSVNDTFSAPRNGGRDNSTQVPNVEQYDDAPSGGTLYAPGCRRSGGSTSFLNQNRPSQDLATGVQWVREIPTDPNSPVKISRNGNPLVQSGNAMPVEYAGRYNNGTDTIPGAYYYSSGASGNNQNDDRSIQRNPPETTVNTIMISGIVPSRTQQAYGGLHNFPRFLEWWSGQNLKFSGSFIQLNFSNYSTAPYDQDIWEPGGTPNGNEVIDYYQPPNRLWGYDVALQFASAGPAASRFVQLSSDRSEFYSEPPANDFYMQNLCRSLRQNAASAPGATGVNLSGLQCPT